MLSKFSVKKPLTIVVAVIIVLLLGVISFTSMTTDMLPKMDLPYVAVITTYPGASPEKVEQSVTKPLEQTLATAGGIKEITSVSNENSSMVILQFEQDTNMDSAMIELSSMVDQVKGQMDDGVGAPTLMKINPDMMPVIVASVDVEGKNSVETSKIVNETVLPALERLDGVASVSAMGLVEDSLRITLDQKKIDALNDKILKSVDSEFASAQAELVKAEKKLAAAQSEYDKQSKTQTDSLAQKAVELEQGIKQAQQGLDALTAPLKEAKEQKATLTKQKEELQKAIDAMTAAGVPVPQEQTKAMEQLTQGLTACEQGIKTMEEQQNTLTETLKSLQQAQTQLEAGKLTLNQELTKASVELENSKKELASKKAEMESAKESAYEKAGLGGQITMDTVGKLLQAQNFSMPAGTLAGEKAEYTVKVGEQFTTVEELKNLSLFHLSAGDIGPVKLSDIATVELKNNAGDLYAKINGNDGVLLSVQKQSTASTAEVSHKVTDAMEQLEQDNPGMHLTNLSDQGEYIDIVIDSVLNNLLLGGLLAVLILLIFLRNLKPTIIIAFSIPISLLFAVAMMYFTGVTLNVISLAGLALGVGMLVDNSIVAIENIYRLRSQGVPAAQAAVKGAGQIAGAIAASTLTTVCVFLPIVFTEGITRQLFTDMGLTIAYSLIASLIVALTLVPTMSATILKKTSEKPHKLFDRFTAFYGRLLDRCLHHKAWVLCGVVVLLGVSAVGAATMGTAFMPEMDSNQVMITMEAPQGSDGEEVRALSDQVIERLTQIEDVQTIGAMQGGGIMGMGSGSGRTVSMYAILKEKREHTSKEVSALIAQKTEDLDCELTVQSSSMDISAMGGSGIELQIKGDDLDKIQSIAKDLAALLKEVPGVTEVNNGMEDTNQELRIVVDKDKATQNGLTVAQVYQAVAASLQDETEATTLNTDSQEYPVIVAQPEGEALTPDNIGELSLTATVDGQSKTVSLSDVAKVETAQSLQSISRDNQMRTLSVSGSVDADHNIGLVGREVENKLASYDVPAGYSVELKGENETINNTLFDLIKMILLAVALIYLIMVAQFQSLLSPFIVMFTIPLAFTGGLLALWITGSEISMIAMLGFLMLAGIVVNNGIVFVDYVNQLRQEGMEKHAALLEAGRTRIRPILMTALTTILGLSTLALGMGSGAEMLQPMAIVTIGGLAYATLLTLFVVPALYDLFNRRPMKNHKLELEEIPDDHPAV